MAQSAFLLDSYIYQNKEDGPKNKPNRSTELRSHIRRKKYSHRNNGSRDLDSTQKENTR